MLCCCLTTPLSNHHSFSFLFSLGSSDRINPVALCFRFFFSVYISYPSALWFVWFFPTCFIFPEILTLFMHFVTYLCFMKVCLWSFILFCYSKCTVPFLHCLCLSVLISGHELTRATSHGLDRGPLCRRSTVSFGLTLLCVVSQAFVIFQAASFLTVVSNCWVGQNLFQLLGFFFLFHRICRSCSISFWVSFRVNYSMCGCRFWVSVGGGEVQSVLHHHLGSETLTYFIDLHLQLSLCFVSAIIYSWLSPFQTSACKGLVHWHFQLKSSIFSCFYTS